jgi:hypothetical protein
MRAETDSLGERIAEHAAHIDAAMHLLLTDLRAFDTAGGWHIQGFRSCAHWLSWRVGWALGTAREHVRVATKLAELPEIDEALRKGETSYAKVRAMTRVATPANEHTLLAEAEFTTGEQLETICRKYAQVQRHGRNSNPADDQDRRHVQRRDLADGMTQIVATLHPEEAAVVWAALERVAKEGCRRDADLRAGADPGPIGTSASVEPDPGADVPAETSHHDPLAEARARNESSREEARAKRFSRADALVTLANEVIRGSRPDRSPIELIVTVAADQLRARADSTLRSATHANADENGNRTANDTTGVADSKPAAACEDSTAAAFCDDPTTAACCEDGTAISWAAARRLACDAGVVRLLEEASGAPLSVGRKTRTIPGAMKRALLRRDRCCRFPGCTNRLFVEGHHIQHWADGGETDLANMMLLCGHHHRFVHEYGYSISFSETGEATFFDPAGISVAPVPPRAQPANLGWPAIKHRNAPLDITAGTPACGWDGSRIDLVACIDELVRADDRVDRLRAQVERQSSSAAPASHRC